MVKDEIMRENGYELLREGSYSKRSGDIVILAQDKETEVVFTVWCKSAGDKPASEVIKYFVDEYKNVDYLSADCSKGRITLYCDISDGKDTAGKIRKADAVLEKINEKYDLVPVCPKCGRIGEAEIVCSENGVRMICGICSSERSLEEKHEKIKQSYKEKSKGRYIFGVIERGTLVGCFFAGVKPGLISGAMGFVIFIAGFLIPYCYYLMCIPTFIGAYMIIRKVNNASHMPVFIRFILASFLYLIITGLLTFAGSFAMSLVFSTGVSVILMDLMNPMIFIVTFAITFAGYVSGAGLSLATDDNI